MQRFVLGALALLLCLVVVNAQADNFDSASHAAAAASEMRQAAAQSDRDASAALEAANREKIAAAAAAARAANTRKDANGLVTAEKKAETQESSDAKKAAEAEAAARAAAEAAERAAAKAAADAAQQRELAQQAAQKLAEAQRQEADTGNVEQRVKSLTDAAALAKAALKTAQEAEQKTHEAREAARAARALSGQSQYRAPAPTYAAAPTAYGSGSSISLLGLFVIGGLFCLIAFFAYTKFFQGDDKASRLSATPGSYYGTTARVSGNVVGDQYA